MRGLRHGRAPVHRGIAIGAVAASACVPAALTLGGRDGGSDAVVVIPDCAEGAATQPCYTGTPGTEGVGACHAGTQSCGGMLGPCNGEVLPAAREDCFNAIDDDCDGVVNNGCPSSLSLGPDRPLMEAGDDGGLVKSAHCPPGSFVTEADSWADLPDHHASGVSIYCATPALVRGNSSYSVNLTRMSSAIEVTGSHNATNARKDDCGTTGLTAITYTVGFADSYVEGLGNHCGTSAVTLQPDNSITFDFTTTGDMTSTFWGTSMQVTAFDLACQPNEVVVGFALREGSWLNAVAPICAALTVVPM